MSKTPRTDAAVDALNESIRAGKEYADHAETHAWFFARQLEKENAELKNCVEKMKNCMNCKHGNAECKCSIEPFERWEACVKSDSRKHWEAENGK